MRWGLYLVVASYVGDESRGRPLQRALVRCIAGIRAEGRWTQPQKETYIVSNPRETSALIPCRC